MYNVKDSSIFQTRSSPVFKTEPVLDADVHQINQIAPTPLSTQDIYVRSMYLCSGLPCPADGCQFTRPALQQIARLIIGQSVLTGHNRSLLPIARFYKADVVERTLDGYAEPVPFVRAWFYWLRETSGARDLQLNIDGGIYREVSLAWRYRSWSCSICGAANNTCGHRIGETIDGNTCYRLIDEVSEVLEGSLVYKAADTETVLAGERGYPSEEPVIVVCESGDPLAEMLERHDLVVDRYQHEEWKPTMCESVTQLWVRGIDPEEMHLQASHYLADRGTALLENPRTNKESIVQRLDGEMRSSEHEEGDHAAIWPI